MYCDTTWEWDRVVRSHDPHYTFPIPKVITVLLGKWELSFSVYIFDHFLWYPSISAKCSYLWGCPHEHVVVDIVKIYTLIYNCSFSKKYIDKSCWNEHLSSNFWENYCSNPLVFQWYQWLMWTNQESLVGRFQDMAIKDDILSYDVESR